MTPTRYRNCTKCTAVYCSPYPSVTQCTKCSWEAKIVKPTTGKKANPDSLYSKIKASGIHKRTVQLRLKRGWSLDDALTVKPGTRTPVGKRLVTVDGITRSVGAWARVTGKQSQTLYARMARGLTGAAVIA